jgi:hypothetical protein
LDNRYFDNVIKELTPFFEEKEIKAQDDIFVSETKAISVKYDEARQMYTLSVAEINEGNVGEFTEINSWLFDDSQTARDASSVGIDFANSLRKEFGVKHTRAANISLPTAVKGDVVNMAGFTKKMLDIFPALKDEYKDHIAIYGNFLYLNFFGEHLVPRLVRLFEEGTKKQIKKFYDVAEDAYVKGDRETVNTLVAVLTAAAYKNEKATAAIKEMLDENKHFLNSFISFIPYFEKDKKLLKALIK